MFLVALFYLKEHIIAKHYQWTRQSTPLSFDRYFEIKELNKLRIIS